MCADAECAEEAMDERERVKAYEYNGFEKRGERDRF